jgi:DNA-binding beta-propeller fold protein YncE
MTSYRLQRRLVASLLSLLALGAASCGGGSAEGTQVEPPVEDTSAPFTQATPAGGLYPASQLVTLESNESATIYYTTDGSVPTVDGVTTLSGSSPLTVAVTHNLTLRFLGIDAKGNVESVNEEAYSFDTNPPIVLLLGGGLIGDLGFLEQGVVTFSVDELESSSVSWSAELGGNSTPGSGSVIASGVLEQPWGLPSFEVPGWKLPLGSSTSLHLFVSDAAGGLGYQVMQVGGLGDEVIPISGRVGDMSITSDSEYLYVSMRQVARVLKFGARPGTPTYHQLLAEITVGPAPEELNITPDDSRVYVTCQNGFYELDVASDSVTGPISMPGGVTPSGADLAPDGLRLFFVTSDGWLRSMNTDPLSGGLHDLNSFTQTEDQMTIGEIDIAPDGEHGTLVWSGNGWYGVNYFDTDISEPNYIAELVGITNLPSNVSSAVISQDSSRAWFGNALGKLARGSLAGGASQLESFNQSLSCTGLTLAPDESVLMITGGGLVGVRLADPDSLELLAFVPSGDGSGTGTGRHMAISPDGKRAYLARNQGGNGELQMLQLEP